LTALPPPKNPKAGELAFVGLVIGSIYGMASAVPFALWDLSPWNALIFPATGFLIGTLLDQRTAS